MGLACMQRLHLAITAILVTAVIILGALLLRQVRIGGDPSPAISEGGNASSASAVAPRIERVPDAEVTLKKLGYEAWVFRWSGGIIDGELRSGPDTTEPRHLGGQPLWDSLQALEAESVKRAGKGSAPRLDSVSGMLILLLGPLKKTDEPSSMVPCRLYIDAQSGATHSDMEPSEALNVAFAGEAQGSDLSVEVFGKWKDVSSSARSTDPTSRYTLLKFRWLTNSGRE
jgi:hypothetical protein